MKMISNNVWQVSWRLLCQKGLTVTNAYAHLHAFLFCLSLLVYQNIHTHSYFCCLFPSVCVCVSLCVCIVSFQVALSCSMHPTVRPKRTSQSLTACALLPLSPLVLTHVFVSLLTRSLCCFSSVSEVMPFCRFSVCGAQTHTCLVLVCKYYQTSAKKAYCNRILQ